MSEVIIYANNCIACHLRREVNNVRRFSSNNKHTFVIRRTDYSDDYRKQAQQIGGAEPFVYYNGKIAPLVGITEEIMENL